MIIVNNGTADSATTEAVLFPFDAVTIPFTAGLRMELIAGKTPGVKNPIVLETGPLGSPDDFDVRFYGTIIPIDGELRMWYMARGTNDKHNGFNSGILKICYATSTDGIHWEKPNLGLVEYNGNKNNNIIKFQKDGENLGVGAIPMIYEPDDSDPQRRFKVVFESQKYGNCIAVAFSADGLTWDIPDYNPVGPGLEQTGLIKINGCYMVNGQGGRHFGQGRKLATFASYDFEHWTQSSCLGHRRDNLPPHPIKYEWNTAEEVHLGAGLWNRGNVVLGVYDIWHGPPTSDRGEVTMDLGLVVTHDGLQYKEPIPDFKFVPSYEETVSKVKSDRTDGKSNALSHGQGMANVGDITFVWYEEWGPGTGVRLAKWQRDRLGYFKKFDYPGRPAYLPPDGTFVDVDPHFISCPFTIDKATSVFANVDGLSQYSELKVEVLTKEFIPIPELSGDNAIPLKQSGLKEPISWKSGNTINSSVKEFRLKVTSAGIRSEDVKIYALYLS